MKNMKQNGDSSRKQLYEAPQVEVMQWLEEVDFLSTSDMGEWDPQDYMAGKVSGTGTPGARTRFTTGKEKI